MTPRPRTLVTGAAGFLGSHLCEALLSAGHEVVGYDNLSTGRLANIGAPLRAPLFRFVEADVLDSPRMVEALADCDLVFHLAAHADVRRNPEHPALVFEQNAHATLALLESMRKSGIRRIAFASTGSVYGENPIIPTPENVPFPIQTSIYAAAKLASEGLLSAYAEAFGFQVFIVRLVSLLGPRYSHGHVADFLAQLSLHPDHLEILGDGRQRKAYLDARDAAQALLLAAQRCRQRVNVLNAGSRCLTVERSARLIAARLGAEPRLRYKGGRRGWPGDVPDIRLDCRRLRKLGWKPRHSVISSLEQTVDYLLEEKNSRTAEITRAACESVNAG
ncbi:MAG: NAD-dependent epimerase/dehydratase family protein [Elusimicrobia bacterium]|nr:NAD-dependent epimerase/dehydratase family protein [Elusimicrobiota bacterium]